MNNNDKVVGFVTSLQLQAKIMEELLKRIKETKGDTITLENDVVESIALGAIKMCEEGIQLFKDIAEEYAQVLKSNNEIALVLTSNAMTASDLGQKVIEYLASIGKLEEFTEYMKSKAVQ